MGYRGKLEERHRARELRARAWTLREIAEELGVSRSSVSVWVRDVPFTPRPRNRGHPTGPHKLRARKEAEIERLHAEGRARIGRLSDRELLVAGLALYAGEGAKRDGAVAFSNSDAGLIRFYCHWLRRFFEIDEGRLRLRIYLHQGLDIDEAHDFWSGLTEIPHSQINKPYRAAPDAALRNSKHPFGCATVTYNCSVTHRQIIGMIAALFGPVQDGGSPLSC
jgi:hypothetical protein